MNAQFYDGITISSQQLLHNTANWRVSGNRPSCDSSFGEIKHEHKDTFKVLQPTVNRMQHLQLLNAGIPMQILKQKAQAKAIGDPTIK